MKGGWGLKLMKPVPKTYQVYVIKRQHSNTEFPNFLELDFTFAQGKECHLVDHSLGEDPVKYFTGSN